MHTKLDSSVKLQVFQGILVPIARPAGGRERRFFHVVLSTYGTSLDPVAQPAGVTEGLPIRYPLQIFLIRSLGQVNRFDRPIFGLSEAEDPRLGELGVMLLAVEPNSVIPADQAKTLSSERWPGQQGQQQEGESQHVDLRRFSMRLWFSATESLT